MGSGGSGGGGGGGSGVAGRGQRGSGVVVLLLRGTGRLTVSRKLNIFGRTATSGTGMIEAGGFTGSSGR